MSDQPLSQEMIDALLRQGGGDAPAEPVAAEDVDGTPLDEAEAGIAVAMPAPAGPPAAAASQAFSSPDAGGGAFSVAGVSFSQPESAPPPGQSVRPAVFSPLPPASSQVGGSSIDLLLDVPLQVTVELGRTNLSVREVLALGAGSVVELEKLAGEPVDLLVNNRLIARGEVVVIDESFGVRVTEIARASEGTGLRR